MIVYKLSAIKRPRYFTWLHAVKDRGVNHLENPFIVWYLSVNRDGLVRDRFNTEIVKPYSTQRMPPSVREPSIVEVNKRGPVVLPVLMSGRPFLFAEGKEALAESGFANFRYSTDEWAQYLSLRPPEVS
jgi:hypothetical protein